MEPQHARLLELMTDLVRQSGELSRQLFYCDGLQVFVKDDGSKVTSIDLAVSKYIVEEAQKRGLRVRTEEMGSTARYGEEGVFDLDPIDSTSDLIKGYQRQPRRSNAAPSLGFWDQKPMAGAVVFPLLGVAPILYSAHATGGAYREQDGHRVRLEIDSKPTRGIVFVSSKQHIPEAQHLSQRLRQMGYTPAPEHGAVFKACSVADSELLKQYPYHGAHGSDLPVVGFVSTKAFLHDVAAAARIIWEAGGVATSPQNHGSRQPWVAANNQAVFDDLMGLLPTK